MTAMKTTVSTEMQQEAAEAVRILREGGIILYPTDTVWGLGCDATNAAAVERIYRLKRSENKKSMLVLCASADMTVRYVNKAPGIAFEVMERATKPRTLSLPGAAGVRAPLIPDEGPLGVPPQPAGSVGGAGGGVRWSGPRTRPGGARPPRGAKGWPGRSSTAGISS